MTYFSHTLTLESPNYPSYYPNNAECMWTVSATSGQLSLLFSKFSLQSDPTCSKDYLQVSGPIKKYRRARICGFPVKNQTLKVEFNHFFKHSKIPSGFTLTSKKSKMVLRFRTDSIIRKSGFRAHIFATGTD